MVKMWLKTAMVFVFLLTVNYSFAAVPNDILERVNDLKGQLEQLQKDKNSAEAKAATLAQEEQRLIATDELLSGAIANYKKDLAAHDAEAANQNAQVIAHNAQCTGTFEDENFVNACNTRAGQLNDWGGRINAHADTLDMYAAGLNERINDLSNATLDWAKRTKENNAALNDIYAQQQALTERINRLLSSPSFRDLIKRNGLSQECTTIEIMPGDASSPNLNTGMERAHRCLQRVWDGAQ